MATVVPLFIQQPTTVTIMSGPCYPRLPRPGGLASKGQRGRRADPYPGFRSGDFSFQDLRVILGAGRRPRDHCREGRRESQLRKHSKGGLSSHLNEPRGKGLKTGTICKSNKGGFVKEIRYTENEDAVVRSPTPQGGACVQKQQSWLRSYWTEDASGCLQLSPGTCEMVRPTSLSSLPLVSGSISTHTYGVHQADTSLLTPSCHLLILHLKALASLLVLLTSSTSFQAVPDCSSLPTLFITARLSPCPSYSLSFF